MLHYKLLWRDVYHRSVTSLSENLFCSRNTMFVSLALDPIGSRVGFPAALFAYLWVTTRTGETARL